MATQTRLPTGDAFFKELTRSSGAGTWASHVDDPDGSPDDDTTYLETSTDALANSFTYDAFSLPASATVQSVAIVIRAKLTTGTGNLRMFAPVDGSATFTPDSPVTVNAGGYADYTATFSTNPVTGIAWTQADVEGTGPKPLGAQFGFFVHNLSGTIRATQTKIVATYTTGSSGGGHRGGITTRTVYTPPTLPTLGAAGFTFTDPTFGSRMARVTDGDFTTDLGSTDKSFATASAGYTPEWNADGTKFFVLQTDGNHLLVSLNRTTLAMTRGPAYLPFAREGTSWDDVNPNILYGVGIYANAHTIVKVDVTSYPWTTTVLLDLDDVVGGLNSPDQTYIGALQVQNQKLMCTFGGSSQEYHYYILHWPLPSGSGSQLVNTLTRNGMDAFNTHFSMHSAQMDLSGRYVEVISTASTVDGRTPAPYRPYFWDTTNDTIYPNTVSGGGHEVLGYNARINADCLGSYDPMQWILTPDLADVDSAPPRVDLITPLLTPGALYTAEHSSWGNAKAGTRQPVVSATYRYYDGPLNVDPVNTAPWRAWDNEVILIDTVAPGGTVRRYCHTRTLVAPDTGTGAFDFYYTPRANIDRQGQFALFTSNWEKDLGISSDVGNHRTDVFLVELTGPGGRQRIPRRRRP